MGNIPSNKGIALSKDEYAKHLLRCEKYKKPILKYRNESPNASRYLVIRNVMQELQVEVKLKKAQAEINKLIWDEEHGLDNVKLMDLAKIYGIANADDVRYIDHIRAALDKLIKKDNLTEMLGFLKQVSSESDTDLKVLIERAKEMKLIGLVPNGKMTYWRILETDDNLTVVKKALGEEGSLMDVLTNKYEVLKKLKIAVNRALEEKDNE